MPEIIKDYGKTVAPEVYIRALQGHQYIPQADQCIRNVVHAYGADRPVVCNPAGHPILTRIADLGCGPGRLTFDFIQQYAEVLGVDISKSFIEYANLHRSARHRLHSHDIYFVEMDFTKDPMPNYILSAPPDPRWHVLVAQGVLHHLHNIDRILFIERCHEMLRDDGILIVGDEFIPDYVTIEERRLNVAAFYFHIIGEAVKGGFHELALEESRNFIDDVLSGEKGCGHADDVILKEIQSSAKIFNELFFSGEEPWATTLVRLDAFIKFVRKYVEQIADHEPNESFNRGDFKTSVNLLVEEMERYGFLPKETYEIGPVKHLGGMGVLVFMKA